jgi:curved DNA-binding protein CbpA
MLPNYYAILAVAPSATLGEIRRAYRKAAFAAHPDRGGSDRLMQRINEAWEVLGNEDRRRAYDLQRAEPQPGPNSQTPPRQRPAATRKSRPRQPASSARPTTFARIAGSILGRALSSLNRLIEPSASKKSRPARARGTIIIPCRYCGQKLRIQPGAAKIRCPKCRHADVLG